MKKIIVGLAFLLLVLPFARSQNVVVSSTPPLPISPGGRLTVTSNTPVIISSVVSQTTLYYTSYKHRFVPIYDGNTTAPYPLCAANSSGACEISIGLGSNWALNTVHDVFAFVSNGAPVLCTNAWASLSARTINLAQFNGMPTNLATLPSCRTSNAATISLGTNLGTYLGSFYTNVSRAGEIDYHLGGAASGGIPASLGICNYYNRVRTTAVVTDSGTTYTYTLAVVRPLRNGSTGKADFLTCVQEDGVTASFGGAMATAATSTGQSAFGLGLDSTTTYSNFGKFYCETVAAVSNNCQGPAAASFFPAAGKHTISVNQNGDGSTSTTYNVNSADALSINVMN